jgi:hypothetical protein
MLDVGEMPLNIGLWVPMDIGLVGYVPMKIEL